MNIKSLILATVALLSVPASVSAQTAIGYTNETTSRNNIFRYTSNTDQRMAMRLSTEKLQCLQGKTIKAIRVAFGSKNSTNSQANLFLTAALDATPLRSETITITSTNKLVEYALSEPYMITGSEKELYVGCSMEIAANYGPFSSDFSKDVKNIFFAYGNGKWTDLYGMGYGCPNIEIVTTETVEFTDLCLKPFEENGYVKQGTSLSYKMQLQNFGTTTVNDFEVVAKVGDGEERSFPFSNVALAPHKTYDFTISGLTASVTGRQDIEVRLKGVNGSTDDETSDNQSVANAYFYPADMQKSVLLEVFTGQTCVNCPSAHTAIANALAQLPSVHVVEIAHHAGFVTDIFTMKEDWTLTSLYNNSTYAPATMYNRTAIGESATPVNGSSSTSEIKTNLQQMNDVRPYVSIDVSGIYDQSTRNVKLNCRFFTHEDMPGDDLRYSIWLVQDNLVANQKGGTADYVHNAVSRGSLTGSAWGEKATFISGQELEIEKNFELPEIIYSTSYEKDDDKNAIPTVLKDMKVVVFVHQQSANDVNACRVFNCTEFSLSDAAVTGDTPSDKVRVLKRQTYYGDVQGVEPDSVATRTLDYAYNSDNQLLRKIERSKDTNIEHWDLTRYFKYDYNADGHLLQTNSLLYGPFDYDGLGWLATNDTVRYEYDAQGRLAKESHPLKYYTFEYDEQGQLVSRSTWNINSISLTATNDLVETFSGFNAFGQPTAVTATSPTGKEWNEYTGTYTYDAEGHLLEEKQYTNETPAVLKFAEYWTYEDGVLTEHRLPTVFGDGAEVENEKEVYTLVDGNKDMVEHEVFLSNGDGTWNRMSGSRCIDEYAYVDADAAPALTVVVNPDELNTANLSVQNATTGRVLFFRNGLPVDTVACSGGLAATMDAEVKNGTYEYLALDGVRAANVVTYTHHTDLPTVSNVRVTSMRQELSGETFVTVGWDNLSVDDRFGFLGNSIFFENMRTEEIGTDDPSVTSLEVPFGIETLKTLYVQSRYKLGRANSQTITIDIDQLATSLDTITSSLIPAQQMYDLQGRPASVTSHGIYIQKGKKVVR